MNTDINKPEEAQISARKEAQIIINNILTRTSDRMFDQAREIAEADIQTLLHAAMAAPTGVNRRPWHFVVVTNPDKRAQLASALPYCHMAKDAPTVIVVCGDKSKFLEGDDSELWVQDLSAASENILLAAHALGLGSVWTCLYPHADRISAARSILGISDDFMPFNIIPVGYVRKTHAPMNKWNPAAITYLP